MIANYGKQFSFASRFSEFESIDTSIALIKSGLIQWIWVDTFFKFPINKLNYSLFNSLNANKCLTSPDLLGRPEDIKNYAKIINHYKIRFDAICCKKDNINNWIRYLEL